MANLVSGVIVLIVVTLAGGNGMRQYVDTGLVALDLANTWDDYLDEPERLPDPAALRQFCAEFSEGEFGEKEFGDEEFGESPGQGSELAAVREMRGRLRAVLACEPP